MNTVDLLKELIEIPSILGDTSVFEELVASRVSDVAETEFIEVPGKGWCVMARNIEDPSLPKIILNGHLDTVEVCNGWEREPFSPVIEGDRLYGLGSADMKGGVAVAVNVFRKAVDMGLNVIFIGTIDEEGDCAGAYAVKEMGVDADLCLITEPSNEKVMMGCRGRYVMDVNVNGASAHGAVPEKGVNAITEAGKLMARLDELPLLEHEVLGKGSVCPLKIEGGTRTLSVPEECYAVIDRHVVPGETKDSVIADMTTLIDSLDSPARFSVGMNKERPTPFLEPYITDDSPLVNMFMETVNGERAYGKSVGDYNVFATMMPTVVYGPHGENWHGPDEWVSVSSVKRVEANYLRFLDKLVAESG